MTEEDKKKEQKKKRKTEKLIFILGFTMIVFVVATYAWFIGLSVAKVNTFQVNIQASEGLSLSLDAENWYDVINLGNTESDVLNNVLLAYETTDASWLGVDRDAWVDDSPDADPEAKTTKELIPVSTNGTMDPANNVLKLFSKTSMTSSQGGYRLIADRYDNSTEEQTGYVVFDLYIKNKVNTTYDKDFDSNKDEAIYLTNQSYVKLTTSAEVPEEDLDDEGKVYGGDGLENSIRIAMMQIGRAASTATPDTLRGITCNYDGSEYLDDDAVTGLCNAYTATNPAYNEGNPEEAEQFITMHDSIGSNHITYGIWEPNDTKHTAASASHFARICRQRTSKTEYSDTECTAIADGTATKTFVITRNVPSEVLADIYDGLNGYTGDIVGAEGVTEGYFEDMSYYTDTENKKGDTRSPFFYLAPNSVTKVRIYIYLEGQDVDNYDISSLGKAFEIQFGFTKNRFEDEEVPEPTPEPEPAP